MSNNNSQKQVNFNVLDEMVSAIKANNLTHISYLLDPEFCDDPVHPNAHDRFGNPLLAHVAVHGDVDMALEFFKAGATPVNPVKNGPLIGKQPYELAFKAGNQRLGSFLQRQTQFFFSRGRVMLDVPVKDNSNSGNYDEPVADWFYYKLDDTGLSSLENWITGTQSVTEEKIEVLLHPDRETAFGLNKEDICADLMDETSILVAFYPQPVQDNRKWNPKI